MIQLIPSEGEGAITNAVLATMLGYIKGVLLLIPTQNDTSKIIKLHEQIARLAKFVDQVRLLKMDRKREQLTIVKSMQDVLTLIVAIVNNPMETIFATLKTLIKIVQEIKEESTEEEFITTQGQLQHTQEKLATTLDSCSFMQSTSLSATKAFDLCKKTNLELVNAMKTISFGRRLEMKSVLQNMLTEFQNTANLIVHYYLIDLNFGWVFASAMTSLSKYMINFFIQVPGSRIEGNTSQLGMYFP